MKNSYIALLFHGINYEDFYSIDVDIFDTFLKKIKEKGILTSRVQDIDYREDIKDKKHISVTFDDGLLSDYTKAFPSLLENKIKASFFITPNLVGQKGYASWDNIREMTKYGMEIGSHGLNHQYLSMVSKEELINELVDSKKIIEDKLSTSVKSFSIPHDDSSAQLENLAYSNGYLFILNSMPNFNDLLSSKLNRVCITKKTSLREINNICKFSKPNMLKKKVNYLLRKKIKNTLGNKTYMKIRHVKFY